MSLSILHIGSPQCSGGGVCRKSTWQRAKPPRAAAPENLRERALQAVASGPQVEAMGSAVEGSQAPGRPLACAPRVVLAPTQHPPVTHTRPPARMIPPQPTAMAPASVLRFGAAGALLAQLPALLLQGHVSQLQATWAWTPAPPARLSVRSPPCQMLASGCLAAGWPRWRGSGWPRWSTPDVPPLACRDAPPIGPTGRGETLRPPSPPRFSGPADCPRQLASTLASFGPSSPGHCCRAIDAVA